MDRIWGTTGEEFIRDTFKNRHGNISDDYDQDRERTRITDQLPLMTWQEWGTPLPMSQGLLLQAILPQIGFMNVFRVSVNTFLEYPDGPTLGTYPLIGIEGTLFGGVVVRLYLLDRGADAVPVLLDPRFTSSQGDSGTPD